MTTGLTRTLEVLSKSRNEAVGPVLLSTLEDAQGATYDTILKALLARRKIAGHVEVLKRWHTLTAEQHADILGGRCHISGGLREAILSDDEQLFANACQVIEGSSEFDLIPTLVTLAENQKNKHAVTATQLIHRLVLRLSEMLHGPRDYNDRRDPQAIRGYVLEALERSVERFRQHQREELIEAFVLLGGMSNELLQNIFNDPHHPCYLTVIHTLTHSNCSGVFELLISSLKCTKTPPSILNVITKRADKPFVTRLLKIVDEQLPGKVVKNIECIRSFAWLRPGEDGFLDFEDEDKARLLKLVALSGVKESALFVLVETFIKSSGSLSRVAACETLATIQGSEANQVVLDTIHDEDPEVQAACVRQIRDRHLAGTMTILLQKLDSPHEVVQEAAREALSEFTFANLLASYEAMAEETRRSTAKLVRKVDKNIVAGLTEEIEAQSRKRRMRAIEMAELLGMVRELSKKLIELLKDEDHLIRASAADLLRQCPEPHVLEALKEAMNDKSTSVRNAASSSLETFAGLPGMEIAASVNSMEGTL